MLYEFANAISLICFSSAFTSLLVIASEESKQGFKFYNGKFVKISHWSMIISAAIGGLFLYMIQSFSLYWRDFIHFFFLLPMLGLIFLIFWSFKLLPKTEKHVRKKREGKLKDVFNFLLTNKNKGLTLSLGYILFLIIFQISVQIWQPMFVQIQKNFSGLLLTILLFLVMFAQAVSGYVVEKVTKNILKIFLSLSILLNLLVSILLYIMRNTDLSFIFLFLNIFTAFFSVRLGLSCSEVFFV